MRRTILGVRFSILMLLGALLWIAQPATAQEREGSGTKARDGSVVLEGGQNSDAERGRTSGRSERGTTGRSGRGTTERGDREVARGEREVIVERDGRVERTRTERSGQERVPDVIRRRDDDRNDDEYYGSAGKKGNGPKFCQSGAGHPVHGMDWCYEKGWGRYNDRVLRDRDREDVIIIRPDRRSRVGDSRGVLDDILDDVVRGPLFDELRWAR